MPYALHGNNGAVQMVSEYRSSAAISYWCSPRRWYGRTCSKRVQNHARQREGMRLRYSVRSAYAARVSVRRQQFANTNAFYRTSLYVRAVGQLKRIHAMTR